MVNTRPTAGGIGDNNGGLTTTTTVDLNTTLLSMQRSMEQMNENIKGLLIFQQFATGEINRMTSGEGTSRGRGGGSQYGSYVNPALALPAPNTGNRPSYVQNRKQLTQREIADKRANNLCFYCDQKFVPGHKCSGQLFSLEICADEGEMLENDVLEVDLCLAREIS
ncbi:hypothetical protein Tco_0608365 [Tanacetum coccineum]